MPVCSKCGKENWFYTTKGNVCKTEGCGNKLENDEEHKNNIRT